MSRINSSKGQYAILFFGCILFHMVGTWSIPLIDRDEPRFAEASREMIERGEYIVPHFNNQLRLDKPPLAYWAQVASYRIFEESDFAARFPSAVAAALVALAILAWGTRMGGEEVGWWGAIIFTLSLQTFVHAKAAVADMWLVLFMTTAHWSAYELVRDRLWPTDQASTLKHQTLFWWFVLYLSLALGFLAKGPSLNPQTSNVVLVVRSLFVACARFPRKRTNRVDAAVNARRDEIACGRCRTCEALQVRARHFAHARNRCSLGSPGVDPNRWRIF